ncbi:hypothetical protein CGCSCA5_v003896 [Colletotrichum siamense]|nr:hypothetical protein CGCSCA5_v003896 [Colletotrichum siamense]KAF4869931.1 hypothetical protein CGCSCA1_v010864 [Colletotrichum siamense]
MRCKSSEASERAWRVSLRAPWHLLPFKCLSSAIFIPYKHETTSRQKLQQQLFPWIIILRISGNQRHTVLATQQALSSGSVQAAASSGHLVLCQWPRPQKTACKVV